LTLQKLKDNYAEILSLGSISHYLFFNRDVQGTLGGGAWVAETVKNMQYLVSNMTSDAENIKRYLHYSGHDSSIQAILAALKLSDDYEELRELPPYGSAIILELHRDKSNKYFVRVVFKRQFDGPFKAYALKSLAGRGCAEMCPFEDYKTLVAEDAIPRDWCTECLSTNVDFCVSGLLQTAQTQSIALIIVVPCLVALIIVLFIIIVILAIKSRRAYQSLQ